MPWSPRAAAALLALLAVLILVVRHELASVRLSEAVPLAAIGSAPAEGRESRTAELSFDLQPATAFLTRSADGEAFAGLRYRAPVRLHRVEGIRADRLPRPALRVAAARLQWSDDGLAWHPASGEAAVEEGRLVLPSTEPRPHAAWRLLVTRSGRGPVTAMPDLRFVTAEMRRLERVRAGLLLAAAVTLLLATAILGVLYRRERPRPATLGRALLDLVHRRGGLFGLLSGGLLLYYNYFFLVKFRVVPILQGDSGTYLANALVRTPGYPLLLDAFDGLIGNWALFPALQLNLLLAAYVLMGYALARIVGGYLPGILFLCCMLQFELPLAYAPQVLTEAPFAALFTIHVAVVGLLLERFSRPRALGAGLVLMLAVAVKPTGMALLGPAALSLLFLRPHRMAGAILLLGPTVLFHLGASSYNYANYGIFAPSSVGGAAIYGHVAANVRADPESAYPELSARLEERLRPVLARRPSSFDSVDHYIRHTKDEFATFLWRVSWPEILAFVRAQEGFADAPGREVRAEASQIAAVLAREAIRRAPAEYAYHVGAHFYGMWRLALRQVELARDLADNLRRIPVARHALAEGQIDAERIEAALDPANLEARRSAPTPGVAAFRALFGSRSLAAAWPVAFALSLIGSFLVFFSFRLGSRARAWCLFSLYANAYMSGSALAIFASYRYAAVAQPVVVALSLLGMLTVIGLLARRR